MRLPCYRRDLAIVYDFIKAVTAKLQMDFTQIVFTSVPNYRMYSEILLQIPLIEWFTAKVATLYLGQINTSSL